MTKSAKLENKPIQGAMDDYRCWAQIATEFLMEIKEHLEADQTVSAKQMVARIDHFLLHDKLPPRSN